MAITYMMITRTHKEIICSCGNHTIAPHNQLGSTSYITLPGEKCPTCGNPVDETLHAGRTFFSNRSKSQTVADPDITSSDHCSFSLHVTRYEFNNDDGYGKKDDDMRLSLEKKNEADLTFSAITPKETKLTMDGKAVPTTKSNLTKALAFCSVSLLPNTVFTALAARMNTTTLAQPVIFLQDNPYFEKFFPLDPKMNSFCALENYLDRLDDTKAKPQQILGLTKREYELYMPHIGQFHRAGFTWSAIQGLKKNRTEGQMEKILEMTWELACRDQHGNIPPSWIYLVMSKQNYDLDTLFDYLTDKIYTYQGINSVREGSQLLADYTRLCELMGVAAEKYPKSLKLRHDLASKNYQVVLKEEEKKKFMSAVSEKKYQSLAYQDEDYSVLVPAEPDDVVFEGAYLGHCVGSYIEKIANDGVQIIFMRRTGKEKLPLVTLDVRNGTLMQAAGAGNRNLYREEAAFVKKWAKAKRIECTIL